jgi:inorganic triphosphatase YgiF
VSIETELKLHISPEHQLRLKRHPFLRSLTSDRPRTQKLYSVYYDTPDLALRRHAMALRLRSVGRQWMQTLKGGGQVSAGLHQHNEWEAIVPSERLDFDVLSASGGQLPQGVRHHLQPVFITDFSRNIRLLKYEGAEIELCLDSGETRAGHASHPISEVELELKSGEPAKLFKLALALLDIVTMHVEHTSKAEYGYKLFSAARPSAHKGRFMVLTKDQSIEDAMRSLIGDCLSHIQSNMPGALLKLDDEYLHQVRIGLRRLRVVLSIALRSQPDDELLALRQQVKELCIGLGSTRDWDVFVTQTLVPICTRLPENTALSALLKVCERRRKEQHKQVVEQLGAPDLQRMLLRFGAWMHTKNNDLADVSLEIFATKTLKKRIEVVVSCGQALRIGGTERLHHLRIACKKLRYCIEMFDFIFDREKSKVYLDVLADLQDVLGRLNDNTVAHRLADSLDSKARHEVIALVHEVIEHDVDELNTEFAKAWKRFTSQDIYWKRPRERNRK